MRRIISAIAVTVLLSVSPLTSWAETYPPTTAESLIGRTETIEGVVSQVSTSNGTTFINFGGRFPHHVFYGVIFRQNAGVFSGVHNLEGRRVAITGMIEDYNGKPQIKLYSPDQLVIR